MKDWEWTPRSWGVLNCSDTMESTTWYCHWLFDYAIIRVYDYATTRLYDYSTIRLYSYVTIRLFAYMITRLCDHIIVTSWLQERPRGHDGKRSPMKITWRVRESEVLYSVLLILHKERGVTYFLFEVSDILWSFLKNCLVAVVQLLYRCFDVVGERWRRLLMQEEEARLRVVIYCR